MILKTIINSNPSFRLKATITLPPPKPNQSVSPTQPLTFSSFSRVFTSEVTNNSIYSSSLRKVIHRALDGENVTVMAYGQTGSGKTHTMVGTDKTPGILPLGIKDIFRLAGESENDVKVRMCELRSDELRRRIAVFNAMGTFAWIRSR